MRYVLVLLAIGTAACAAKPAPVVTPPLDLGPADALVEAGCYRCLAQAFQMYDRALATAAAPPRARDQAFVTAALLALREKELGLEASPWIDRASRLANEAERPYLDSIDRLPWTDAGSSVDFEVPARRSAGPPAAAAPFAPGPHPVLDAYLLATLQCSPRRGIDPSAIPYLDLSRPLIRYRIGLCGIDHREHLEAVAAADPRFVEASFFIGRYEMSLGVMPSGSIRTPSREWLTRAVPPLVVAHEGLPEAPIVTIVLAGLMRSRTELTRALALYDEALALRPTQGDGLLGRVVTLTYLKRPDDAIATATRLIELDRFHVGPAHYWRGWNHYQSGRLETAASDVAVARRLWINDDVMTLSGMVAYDQKRPRDARTDFQGALQMNSNKCIARWYIGLLDVDDSQWAPAIQAFAAAGACYDDAAKASRAEIEGLPPDLPADTRAQQITSINEAVADALLQAGRAYFNAAQASMRLGDKPAARTFAESAASYEAMKERAEGLLDSLGAK